MFGLVARLASVCCAFAVSRSPARLIKAAFLDQPRRQYRFVLGGSFGWLTGVAAGRYNGLMNASLFDQVRELSVEEQLEAAWYESQRPDLSVNFWGIWKDCVIGAVDF